MDEVFPEKVRWRINDEFSRSKDHCYLDNAGAALYSKKQIKDWSENLLNNIYGNPHSAGYASKACGDEIDQVRQRVLAFFNTSSAEHSVIFTSGATAAIKLVLENFDWNRHYTSLYRGNDRGTYAYSAVNHTSIVGGRILAQNAGASVVCLKDEELFHESRTKKLSRNYQLQDNEPTTNSLFAYPAQCNFSGKKYPLRFVEYIQDGVLDKHLRVENTKWHCLLDAAAFCATNHLNLNEVKADFVCLSFYKLFGYPTGLGALIVRNDAADTLKKRYFGGGTVDLSIPSGHYLKMRETLHDRFEDGTLPYLSILALSSGFDTLDRLGINMHQISLHVSRLARFAKQELSNVKHWNGMPLAEIYGCDEIHDVSTHGGIIAFNLKRADGSYFGYVEVLHLANLNSIQIRTGCFCNVGACQRYLNLSDDDLLSNYKTGHVCGDEHDLIDGRPTGAVRISFSYYTSVVDINRMMKMLKESFLEAEPTLTFYKSSEDTNAVALLEPCRRILKSICLYPIKSCGAMKVKSWWLTNRGLEYDRQWMVVAANGIALTQKQEPLLCRVLPVINKLTKTLQLTFSGEDPIAVRYSYEDMDTFNLCTSKVCGDRISGVDCGDEVAEWLSFHLQREKLRLIRQCDSDERSSTVQENRGRANEEKTQISLANQAQYLLINANSVDLLQTRFNDPELLSETFLDRFRANLIVEGAEAFEETEWSTISIGKVQFKVEGPCTRCQMICIDQHTGVKNRKPLVELSRALEGKLRFGVYCSNVSSNMSHILNVGDEITLVN